MQAQAAPAVDALLTFLQATTSNAETNGFLRSDWPCGRPSNLLLRRCSSWQQHSARSSAHRVLSSPGWFGNTLRTFLNIKNWFGRDIRGVAAAADAYFGKSLSDLTLAEMAYIAGLARAPYLLARNLERGAARRDRVLDRMAEAGTISLAQAASAKVQALILTPAPKQSP